MKKNVKVGDIQLSEAQIKEALKARAEGTALYDGSDDAMVDFGKANSFSDEDSTAKRFSIRIANAGNTDAKLQLNTVLAAITGATVMAEGTASSITVAGAPRSVDVLKKYIENNPIRLRSIKLNVSDVAQLDEPIIYHRESPFETMAEEQRVPSEYQSQNTNNPKMSEVSDVKDWVLSDQSTIYFNVLAGKTVNLSLLLGAAIDPAKALNKKASAAAQTAARMYVETKSK